MKVFKCPQCGHPIFFENNFCLNCNSKVGFSAHNLDFVLVDEYNVIYCVNHKRHVCNWVALNSQTDEFCLACSFNGMIPTLEDTANFEKWQQMEMAKHRLIYQLLSLQLPLIPKSKDQIKGLSFDFLASDNTGSRMTGHINGLVTILLEEGDVLHREQIRKNLSEPYRTLLGHFRHEIGHYYWMLLADYNDQARFRNIFGDETVNYADALKVHYQTDAPKDWNQRFISKYASSHPWEDWAETWAHYMHIMDTLETAHYLGLSLESRSHASYMNLERAKNPYTTTAFAKIIEDSVALTCAGNSLNRSMGLSDIYPFVWSDSIYSKLKFIHEFVKSHQQQEM